MCGSFGQNVFWWIRGFRATKMVQIKLQQAKYHLWDATLICTTRISCCVDTLYLTFCMSLTLKWYWIQVHLGTVFGWEHIVELLYSNEQKMAPEGKRTPSGATYCKKKDRVFKQHVSSCLLHVSFFACVCRVWLVFVTWKSL